MVIYSQRIDAADFSDGAQSCCKLPLRCLAEEVDGSKREPLGTTDFGLVFFLPIGFFWVPGIFDP